MQSRNKYAAKSKFEHRDGRSDTVSLRKNKEPSEIRSTCLGRFVFLASLPFQRHVRPLSFGDNSSGTCATPFTGHAINILNSLLRGFWINLLDVPDEKNWPVAYVRTRAARPTDRLSIANNSVFVTSVRLHGGKGTELRRRDPLVIYIMEDETNAIKR